MRELSVPARRLIVVGPDAGWAGRRGGGAEPERKYERGNG